jgi:hypothetical protein
MRFVLGLAAVAARPRQKDQRDQTDGYDQYADDLGQGNEAGFHLCVTYTRPRAFCKGPGVQAGLSAFRAARHGSNRRAG